MPKIMHMDKNYSGGGIKCNYPKLKIIPVNFKYSDLSIESWAGQYAASGSVDVDLSDFESISNIGCSLGKSLFFATLGRAQLQSNNTKLYCEFIRPATFASNFEMTVTLIVYGE